MKSFLHLLLLGSLLIGINDSPTFASADLSAEKVFEHSEVLWGFDFLSAKEMILTDQAGKVFLLDLESGATNTVQNTPSIFYKGQGGLMDIRLHPEFKSNRLIYISYSTRTESGSSTRLARARLEENELKELQILFTAKPYISATNHYGSRIAFDGKGYVFLSIGDRTKRDLAQDLSTHMGSVIRLHDDGRVPEDNPFAKDSKARSEIWSYGHRNPQGLFYDKDSDELWLHEHGPRGGDEINLVKPGRNYGWPKVTKGREYWGPKIGKEKSEGMVEPVHSYTPSIAPSGFIRYSGKKFPDWKSHFFLGALALRHLNKVQIEDGVFVNEERYFESLKERIRAVGESPSGDIYFSADSGKLYRILKTEASEKTAQ